MKTIYLALVLALVSTTEAAQLNTMKFHKSHHQHRAHGDDEEPMQVKGYKSTRIDNGADDDANILGWKGEAWATSSSVDVFTI